MNHTSVVQSLRRDIALLPNRIITDNEMALHVKCGTENLIMEAEELPYSDAQQTRTNILLA